MPENHHGHPTSEELDAFSRGALPADVTSNIESHISRCRPCCETLVGLSSDDTFVTRLREADLEAAERTIDHGTGADRDPMSSVASTDEIPAPLLEHARYEVTELIGRGGMGRVYKARHRLMDRMVALKVIHQGLVRDHEAFDRFHREVKAAARLAHPNIVTAYDAERADDLHYLVMEHVDGTDLAELVRTNGVPSIRDACDYVRQAALGLQHAHETGMVHRDIKPHNLMVTPGGTVKILDFGLTSLAPTRRDDPNIVDAAGNDRGELTLEGSIMGTPDYISPEQAEDARRADIRADIYSLGATFYFLLSGRPPFAEGSVTDKLASHAKQEPKPIEDVQPEIPDPVSGILRKMMAKDPADRFQTPEEVAEALEPFATPSENGDGARSRPWRRAAVVALFACSLVLAGIVVIVKMGEATLRFEINDPDVAVTFRDETIDVKTPDGKKFRVKPSSKQTFVVSRDGVEMETDWVRLGWGQEATIRIDVVDDQLVLTSSDPRIESDRRPVAGRDSTRAADSAPDGPPNATDDPLKRDFERLLEAARSAATDDEWDRVVVTHSMALTSLPLDDSRELLSLLVNLPADSHQALLQDGYLRWKLDSLGSQRGDAAIRFLLALTRHYPPRRALSEKQLRERFRQADVGFLVLDLPDSSKQSIVWYVLYRQEGINAPITLPICGASLETTRAVVDPDVRGEIAAVVDRPYSDPPRAVNTEPATMQALDELVDAYQASGSDEELKKAFRRHAPALYGLPIGMSRSLIELVSRLPETTRESLRENGYLKWRYNALDQDIKQLVARIQNVGIEAYSDDSERMQRVAKSLAEAIPRMLAAADVGLVIMDSPDSPGQVVAWYTSTPYVETPAMLPILGTASPKDKVLKRQLVELKRKTYSDTLPHGRSGE